MSTIEKALDYLSRRSHTEYEIRLKLKKAEYPEREIEETVSQLTEDGYINDADFAERFLRLLIEKGRGRRRIVDEMRRRGLSESLCRHAIETCMSEDDERENALRYAETIIEKMPDDTGVQELRRKINAKMVVQGYPYDLINWTLRNVAMENTEGCEDV